MTDRGILRIAREFRSGILGHGSSAKMCAMVCYPLQSLFSCVGLEARCVEVALDRTNHVFLALPDGRVLDPTADQFGGPAVYLGPPLSYHRNREKTENRD